MTSSLLGNREGDAAAPVTLHPICLLKLMCLRQLPWRLESHAVTHSQEQLLKSEEASDAADPFGVTRLPFQA